MPPDLPSTTGGEPVPTWRWLLADEAGVAMSEPDVAFPSQQAAEDWLQDNFQDLADAGVGTVSLNDGEHAVYGPMYLSPEGAGPAAEAEI